MVEEKEVKLRSLWSIYEICKVYNRGIAISNDEDTYSNNNKFTCDECGCTYTTSNGLIRVLKVQ